MLLKNHWQRGSDNAALLHVLLGHDSRSLSVSFLLQTLFNWARGFFLLCIVTGSFNEVLGTEHQKRIRCQRTVVRQRMHWLVNDFFLLFLNGLLHKNFSRSDRLCSKPFHLDNRLRRWNSLQRLLELLVLMRLCLLDEAVGVEREEFCLKSFGHLFFLMLLLLFNYDLLVLV